MTDVSNLTAKQNQASVFDGTVLSPGGVNSAEYGANVLTPTLTTADATQLSDITRDYDVYLDVTTGGTVNVLKIGPTSTPAHTLVASSSWVAGTLYSFRLPAGWYVEWTGTSTVLAVTAVSC